MKKFLSILLAVMMVLSSTVSYAAPTLAGVADSAVEYAPVVDDVPAVEDDVDSKEEEASLAEETTTAEAETYYEFNTAGDPEVSTGSSSRGETYSQGTFDGQGCLVVDLSPIPVGETTKNVNNIHTGSRFACNIRNGGFKSFEMRYKIDAPEEYADNLSSVQSTVHAWNGSTPVSLGVKQLTRAEDGWYYISIAGPRNHAISSIQVSFDLLVDELGGSTRKETTEVDGKTVTTTYYTVTEAFNSAKIYVDYVRIAQYAPDVTIENDLQYIADFRETLQGGVYTLEEIRNKLDPEDVMFDKGYYLEALRADDEVFTDNVTFTEDATYTAVWDRIKFLKNWEFTNGAETGATVGNVATTLYEDGSVLLYKPTSTEPKITLSFDRIEVEDIYDIVSRVKFVNTGFSGVSKKQNFVYVSGWNSKGKEHGEVSKTTTEADGTYGGTMGGATFFIEKDDEWTIGRFSTSNDFASGKVAADTVALKGFRFNLNNVLTKDADHGVYVDYIRILGKDPDAGDNVIVDVTHPIVEIPDFKIVLDDTTTAQDVLDAAEAEIKAAGYFGDYEAKAVIFDGEELSPDTVLKDAGAVDQSTIAVALGTRVLLADYEFTNGLTAGVGAGASKGSATVSHDPNNGTALLKTGENGAGNIQFKLEKMNINTADIKKIYVRYRVNGNYDVSLKGAGATNLYYTTDTVTSLSNAGGVTTLPGPGLKSYNKWIVGDLTKNISNFQSKGSYLTGLRFDFATDTAYPQSAGSVIEVDYVRFLGDFASSYFLYIDGDLVEVDCTGMTNVSELLASDAVNATGKTPVALRIVGTDTILNSDSKIDELSEDERYEVIWSKADDFDFDFDKLLEKGSNIIDPSYAKAVKDGDNYYASLTSRIVLQHLNIPANKLNRIFFTLQSSVTPGGSPAMFWDSVKDTQDATTDGFSVTSVATVGSGVVSGNVEANSPYTVSVNPALLKNTQPDNYKGRVDMKTSGLKFLRWDLGNNFIVDDIRFESVDVAQAAVLDGIFGDESVTLTVPYGSTTTVEQLISKMDLDTEARYVSAISKPDGTKLASDSLITEVLGGKTGVLKFECVERLPINLVVEGETVAAYFENSDTVSDLFEKVSVSDIYKVPRAVRIPDTNTLLYAEESLADISAGDTLELIYSTHDDFGFDFDTSSKVSANLGTLSAVDANGYRTMKGTGEHRLKFDNLGIPANKLKGFYFVAKVSNSSIVTGQRGVFWDGKGASNANGTYEHGAKVISGDTSKNNEFFTLYHDASKILDTSIGKDNVSLKADGLNYMRYDFKSLTTEETTVVIDDFRFVSEDILPVAIIDLSACDLEDYVLPYNDTMTVEDAIRKISADTEIDESDFYIISLGDGETVWDILDGKDGFIKPEIKGYESVTVDLNDLPDSAEESKSFPYSIYTNVEDILNKISFRNGVTPAGLKNSEGTLYTGKAKLSEIPGIENGLTLEYTVSYNVAVSGVANVDFRGVNTATNLGDSLTYTMLKDDTIADVVAKLNEKLAATDNQVYTYVIEGLRTVTDGERYNIPADTKISAVASANNVEIGGTINLVAVWDEATLLKAYEFNENISLSKLGISEQRCTTSIDSTTDEGISALKLTASASGGAYISFENLKIPSSEILDIVANVKVSEEFSPSHFFIFSLDGKEDSSTGQKNLKTLVKGQYDILSLKKNLGGASKVFAAGGDLTKFRFLQYAGAPDDGHSVHYDYVRVYGKTLLPEVNVLTDGLDKSIFKFNSYLTDVDYDKNMTFADLCDKLGFEAIDDDKAATVLCFTSADGTVTYSMGDNMYEKLGGAGTVDIRPVVQKVYTTTFVVDFTEQSEKVSEAVRNHAKLVVSDSTNTVADLIALVSDFGDGYVRLAGLSAEKGGELLPTTASLIPSEVNGAEITYYAVWDSDNFSTLYSLEFADNSGYKINSTGKNSKYEPGAVVNGKANDGMDPAFITNDGNGYITLHFDADDTVKAAATTAGLKPGIYDYNILPLTINGDPFIPANTIDSVIIRLRYNISDLAEKTDIYAPAYGQDTRELDPNSFMLAHLYYTNSSSATFGEGTAKKIYVDYTDPLYNNAWITLVIPASEFKMDENGLYEIRFDGNDLMPDGSSLDIDYIRFVKKPGDHIVDNGDVKSFEENPDLTHSIRANSERNGVRVKGQYSAHLAYNRDFDDMYYATEIGMMFASAVRLKDSAKLTMENYNDKSFNTSSLILAAYNRTAGEDKTNPFTFIEEDPVYSAVLYNIPVKNYETPFHIRPFAKYAGTYIYGKVATVSFMEIADDILSKSSCCKGDVKTCSKSNVVHQYILDCKAEYEAYNDGLKVAHDVLGKFSNIVSSPSNLVGNIVIPTGDNVSVAGSTATFDVFSVADGAVKSITVNTANTYPAVVADGKLTASYELKPCAVVNDNGTNYIMSLGYARDGESGYYYGINKSDASILAGSDSNDMFIRNTFVPESPFTKVRRSSQKSGSNDYIDYTSSYFLGDFSFGTYGFSTTNWAGVEIKLADTGKTAVATSNTKVVIKTIKSKDNVSWSVMSNNDLNGMSDFDSIYFNEITYIVSNNVNNKPSNENKDACPMQVEDLVFLFGVVDETKPMKKTYDSDLPSASDATPIFADANFTKGFEIGGMESSDTKTGVFVPTEETYFVVSEDGEEANKNYKETSGDKNYADWIIDPIYTFDYYNVFDNIISVSDQYNKNGFEFKTLYSGDYRDLRWSIMTDAKYKDAFNKYFKAYELKNATSSTGSYILKDNAESKIIEYKNEMVNGTATPVLSMTLNNSAFFSQKAYHKWSSNSSDSRDLWHFWPHLLIEQDTGVYPVDANNPVNSAAADRIFCEFDVRLTKYSADYNSGSDGSAMTFMLYSYLRPKAKTGTLLWLGIDIARDDNSERNEIGWRRDSGANTYMYKLRDADVYGSYSKSITATLNRNVSITSPTKWQHVKVDLTPHIDEAIKRVNAEDAYGLGVTTREDWFFNGVNIGFECHDNVDATFEIANFNFYSYNETEATPAE